MSNIQKHRNTFLNFIQPRRSLSSNTELLSFPDYIGDGVALILTVPGGPASREAQQCWSSLEPAPQPRQWKDLGRGGAGPTSNSTHTVTLTRALSTVFFQNISLPSSLPRRRLDPGISSITSVNASNVPQRTSEK